MHGFNFKEKYCQAYSGTIATAETNPSGGTAAFDIMSHVDTIVPFYPSYGPQPYAGPYVNAKVQIYSDSALTNLLGATGLPGSTGLDLNAFPSGSTTVYVVTTPVGYNPSINGGNRYSTLSLSVEVAGGTVSIGNPNSTAIPASINEAPWSYEYDYGFAAMLIPQSEMGNAKTISSIEFKVDNITSNFTANGQKIIMGHISETSFSTTTPTVDLANYTVSNKTTVKGTFSKSYTTADNDTWIEFPLTSNFSYNGSDSLVIMWENRDGSYEFSGPNTYYDTSFGNSLTAYRNKDGSYPSGLSCYLTTERPIMRINY